MTTTVIEKPEGDEGRVVYHYTTQNGLLGIINYGEIWASKIQYLNDTSEFRATLAMTEDLLKKRLGAGKSTDERQTLETMREAIHSIRSINVCVCSFSDDGDSLSQWRAYSGPYGGYAIGFSLERLYTLAQSNKCELVRCIYDDGKKELEIRKLIEVAVQVGMVVSEKRIQIKPGYYPVGVEDFLTGLTRLAPKLKDKAFRSEEEWRLISEPIDCTSSEFAFRVGPSMIIPYFKFKFGNTPNTNPIVKVRVGPTPHPELAIESVHALLMARSLTNGIYTFEFDDKRQPAYPTVSGSNIPYRNW